MAVVTLPSFFPIKESSMRLRSVQQSFTSPLSGYTQVSAAITQKWEADITLRPMTNLEAGAIRAFLAKLNGMENTFKIYDPDRKLPLGTAKTTPGTPLVNGAGQTGTTINVDGLPLSATNYLVEGDFIEFNGEFKMVVAPVNTNGSGQAAIQFRPAIRNAPADNAPVIVQSAACAMMLSEPKIEWNSDKIKVHTISLSAIEAI
jgi:hypothetical protein